MDYEKKYNEALERAKSFEEKYGGGYAGYIFPELTESDDERTRKDFIEFLADVNRNYKLIPARYMDWIEKQKDKMTAEEYESSELFQLKLKTRYANGYQDGLAQKENPKTADSIPSNCVSDAKCEDRWHKVTDSLPDNPREVLCKDEAGNYFIGRYYVGEGWDISNYDDEDKPHLLNPPVSKWIDFPSEKQKEQKPAEWSEEDDQLIGFIFDLLNDLIWRKDWAMSKEECLERLKSLRPSWKPSEEQMRVYEDAISCIPEFYKPKSTLKALLEQLKKLM